MTAALFNSMFNLGNLLAPLVASGLYDAGGYKFTTDTMMIISTVYTFVFIVFMRAC
jgi:predicted MFS family arabinose efflux permease